MIKTIRYRLLVYKTHIDTFIGDALMSLNQLKIVVECPKM
jgi:hypothetical protein